MSISNETEILVLDYGYVRFVESWGSDERIIESARMSTNKGFQGWGVHCKICGYNKDKYDLAPVWCGEIGEIGQEHQWVSGDEKLLRYLYEHKHTTPFEMAGMTIEVQAPIFVFREWHRHRTQSYNEMSARYTPLPDLNYLPNFDRIVEGAKEKANKQAGSVSDFSADEVSKWISDLQLFYRSSQNLYERGLLWGVPKEVARVCLPVARYSRMRASANLRNWLAFLTLRMDSAAQWEIRQYANAVGGFIAELFPRTWELFIEGRKQN